MDAKLSFRYDREGDILCIDKRPPYPEQGSEELGDEVIARLNPATGELDIVQQINALASTAREVALIVLEDHLHGCADSAIKEDKGAAAITEMVTVLRKALRQ